MGQEEEKELMLIRMETLKTMIGKLKNKSKDPGKTNTNKPAITRVSSSTTTTPLPSTLHHNGINKSIPSNPHTSKIQTKNVKTLFDPKSLSLNQTTSNHIVTTATSIKAVPKRTAPCVSQYKVNHQLSPTKPYTATTNVNHTAKPHCNSVANSRQNSSTPSTAFSLPSSSASNLSPNTTSKLLLKTVTTTSFTTKTTSSTCSQRHQAKPVKNAIECLIKHHPNKNIPVQTTAKPTASKVKTATETKPTANLTQNSTSAGKSGKILFQRTNKVLFERQPTNQSYSKHNQPYRLNNSLDFAQEFKLIQNRQNNKRPNVTATSSNFRRPPAPETCERARTILSKYKVVHGKDTPPLTIKKVVNKDINSNYSNIPASFVPLSSSTASVPPTGRILYEKPKGVFSGFSAYSKKVNKPRKYVDEVLPEMVISNKTVRALVEKLQNGRIYHPSGKVPFVSRRLSYMKSTAALNPFILKKQNTLPSRTTTNSNKKEIILSRHGNNFQVAGNLKSLRRLSRSHGKNLSVSQNSNITAKQYLASQLLKKTRLTARKKVEKKKEYCIFFNRYGKCKREEKCPFIHDPDKIAICTRFLRGTCKGDNCLFSHKLDPDKMPVCSYFLRGECSRDDCPYRHVNVGDKASICDDFVKGYCPKGKECAKKHILECEEFSNTGVCSSRKTCNLMHRQRNIPRKRKLSGSRPPKGFQSKQKRVASETNEELRNDEVKIDTETKQKQAKKHMIPKFVSDNIKLLRESTSEKPTSFSDIKRFYESTKNEKENAKNDNDKKSNDLWDNDFIPLSNYSGGESEDEDDENDEFIRRLFTFKKDSSSIKK